MFSLVGKSAVVTGAGSGIGQAIAIALAKQGAFVDVLEVNVEGANDTVEQIRSAGGQADAVLHLLDVHFDLEALLASAYLQCKPAPPAPGGSKELSFCAQFH